MNIYLPSPLSASVTGAPADSRLLPAAGLQLRIVSITAVCNSESHYLVQAEVQEPECSLFLSSAWNEIQKKRQLYLK